VLEVDVLLQRKIRLSFWAGRLRLRLGSWVIDVMGSPGLKLTTTLVSSW